MKNNYLIKGDVVEIYPMRGDGTILISLSDLEIAKRHTWSINSTGYAASGTWRGGRIRLHSILAHVSDRLVVDHHNGNKLDNRRLNLQVVSRSINNYATKRGVNGVPYCGVFFEKRNGRFYIKKHWMTPKSGSSKNATDMAILRDVQLIGRFGLDAKTNVLPPFPLGCRIEVR